MCLCFGNKQTQKTNNRTNQSKQRETKTGNQNNQIPKNVPIIKNQLVSSHIYKTGNEQIQMNIKMQKSATNSQRPMSISDELLSFKEENSHNDKEHHELTPSELALGNEIDEKINSLQPKSQLSQNLSECNEIDINDKQPRANEKEMTKEEKLKTLNKLSLTGTFHKTASIMVVNYQNLSKF